MSTLYPKISKNYGNKGSYPLSFGQKRLWLIDRLGSGSRQYNLISATRIKGKLDTGILEKSLNYIIEKHEILRTVFKTENGRVEQVVFPHLDISLDYRNLDYALPDEREDLFNSIVNQECERVFDLSEGPLLNAVLVRMRHNEYIFLLNVHHIISDGWSMQLLLQAIVENYISISQGVLPSDISPPVQYGDYAVWQRDCFNNGVFDADIEYWKEYLSGAPSMLPLPADFPRPKTQEIEGRVYRFELDRNLTEKIIGLCLKEKVTLFTFLLTCFNVLLHLYTGEDDILVGIPSSGRNSYELERLIGYFANTLIVRTKLSGDITFSQLIKNTADNLLNIYEHQFVPFDKLTEEIHPQRDMSYNPLFQVFFSLYSKKFHDINLGDLTIEPVFIDKKTSKFDLSFEIEECRRRVWIGIEYSSGLFTDATIKNMSRHYVNIISCVAENTGVNISGIPILSEDEFKKIIFNWNRTESGFPEDKCIHHLFEDKVRLYEHKTAIIYNADSITYGELDKKASLIAYNLASLGAEPKDRIGICMRKGIDLVPALIGILKAGCCYVPIDPEMPSKRIESIIRDSEPKKIMVDKNTQSKLKNIQDDGIILFENLLLKMPDDILPDNKAHPSDLAYIIYTSGSTGEPKGVQITHKSVVNFLTSMKSKPGMDHTDTLLSVTSITFDISVLELFLPLISGATLILVASEECRDGIKLENHITRLKPTIMQATPATWRLLLNAGWEGDANRLKILCGGEALERNMAKQLLNRGREVWNLYGPTETTVWSLIYKLTGEEDEIPVGYPIANTKVYILDKYSNPVPPGITGDIYISGCGVAKGYWKRHDETVKKFCPDKFADGLMMYSTGDRGKYGRDGLVYFLGRSDYQLKIRGYRIEAGEIETRILKFGGIGNCVVTRHIENNGEASLAAYIECRNNKSIDTKALLRYLSDHLPGYMVPAYYIVMDRFPLTISGKIDRKQLPLPTTEDNATGTFKKPGNEFEEKLLKIWEDILMIRPISVNTSFFSLGGNSLLGTVIISRIKETFNIDLPLKMLFENPTVEKLASAIEISLIEQLNDIELDEMLGEID